MPGCLYKQTPDPFIACFGYWSPVLRFADGVFGWRKAEITHKFAGTAESAEIEYLGDCRNGGKRIYSMHAAQQPDYFFVRFG